MENQQLIYQKLEAFIRKFYINELIRGTMFFIGLGLLYFLLTLFIEYILWLKPLGRTILFWIFIAVELYLLFWYILLPLFKLFKLQRGIGYNQASIIIGSHFAEVSDKLINFLQLIESNNQYGKSELLVASIEQKASALQLVPFVNAINYSGNKKYFPLALIPILLLVFFFASGNSGMISQSLNRVVNFNTAYLPPAAFKFVVLNADLQTKEGEDFVLRIKTVGKIIPENAVIIIDSERYFMESDNAGVFKYKIVKPFRNVVFHIEANTIVSPDYTLKVISVPTIANFEMRLKFPSYLNKNEETIKGTGNAIIPEGTIVQWKISAQATNNITWQEGKLKLAFSNIENTFVLSKSITQDTDYQIYTSNDKVKNHEKLGYQLAVVKDKFPTINVVNPPDSLMLDKNYVVGQIADDYAVSKLEIVYFQRDKPDSVKRGIIAVKKASFDQFIFSFPGNLSVTQGIIYDYYFEVFDNDVIHNFKSTKSSIFTNRIPTQEEKVDQILKQQNDNINSLEKSLKNQDKQISEIEKLQKTGKEKDILDFKDQKKVNDFIKRQMEQDEIMKGFTKKMNDNLDQFKTDKKDELKEELQKRMDKAEKDLEKNQKLLDELKELNDKIQNDELLIKLDKFKQNSKNQAKTLEQLVELTKRFYVEKKLEQLGDKLDKLAGKQEDLINSEKENKTEKQQDINAEFENIQKELANLNKENKELKSPFDLAIDLDKQESIKSDLKKSAEQLKEGNKEQAKPTQKSASKKIREMAQKIAESKGSGEMEQLQEDVAMMRQVVDNLLAFSLSQEDLMKQFRKFKSGSPAFNKNIKRQQELKQQFKHVDDSLFAMSLRNPKIAEDITKEIGNVNYNIESALNSLAEAQLPKGLSHQQYTISAANKLGDFLSDMLNNMQMKMSGMLSGKGKSGQGKGMQLPDIIKKQEGLGDKMKAGVKKGDKGDNGEKGQKDKFSKGNQEGEEGEGDAQAVMEIYKEQKQLREALQKELDRQGLAARGQGVLEQMKQIEKQILNKGFNNETLQRILNINQDLLKLKSALQQQGDESTRQSESNKKEFDNQSNALPSVLLYYLNSIEILNRQSLPLHANFNKKVQEYFNKK